MMADALLNIAFDPTSMAEIARMFEFEVILTEELAIANQEGIDIITAAAQANTWVVFQHPTGPLADSLTGVLISPMEAAMTAGVPYAWRRERGFVGMMDSLGRIGTDVAEPYAQPALDANADKVMALYEQAVAKTWLRIGGV